MERGPGDGRRDALDPGPDAGDQRARGRRRHLRSRGLNDLLAGAPGQLLRFDSPTATPAVVAGGLIGPTGLAYDPHRNELIVSETFTGLVKRIALTQ